MSPQGKSIGATIALIASMGAVILAMAYSGRNNFAMREEEAGRAIVMAARGWAEWPKAAAPPACEWDPTGNFYLVTPCEDDGIVFFNNTWIRKRWTPAQRREL